MNQMNRSGRILELNTVLSMAAELAVSDDAKNRILNRVPVYDIDEASHLLAETEQARLLILKKGAPSFGGVSNILDSVKRADMGGSLTPAELLRIAAVYRCSAGLSSYCGEEAAGCLEVYFRTITPNKYLEEKISTSIVSEEEIADAASSELADIRRHIRIQSAKVRESLQKIISSPSYAKYLREPIITMRDDRYVVPVKSEFKNEIQGLIHDVSSSGSTFFIEPMSAVNANNAVRELLNKEKREIERILAELSAEVAAKQEQLAENYRLIVMLDDIFARARFALQLNSSVPELRTDGCFSLKNARHPLIDPAKVIPVSLRLGEEFDALIITGPNTGGKTVALKTAGLMTLMAECGLEIPTDSGSSVNLYQCVYADIGDEQSIEQSLSTFSSHMKTIVDIVEACDDASLVLFDELGAGTDPSEGAALAVSLIEYCMQCGAKVIATTHYAELKLFALRTPRVINASCEFDVETLRPTYRLQIGIPGKSNAFAISRRLGLPEHIISHANELIDNNDKDFEDVLSQLEEKRQEMERAGREAEFLKAETEKLHRQSESYYNEIRKEREKLLSQAKKEAREIIEDARSASNAAYDEIRSLRKAIRSESGTANYNQRQSEIRRNLNEAEGRLAPEQMPQQKKVSARKPIVGDTVELLKFGTTATVLSINKDGSLVLQAGSMKLTAKENEVYLNAASAAPKTKHKPEPQTREFHKEAGPMELDLRGMSAGEALIVLNQFLDNAVMTKLPTARIIHGKGTGVLRKAVHDELKHSRYIKSFRLGSYGEGEDGVTIVEF